MQMKSLWDSPIHFRGTAFMPLQCCIGNMAPE